MSLKLARRLLQLTCLLTAVAIPLVVHAFLTRPFRSSDEADTSSRTSKPIKQLSTSPPWNHPASTEFQKVATKKLRRPLFDAPPPTPAAKKRPAPLALKLIGSIIEPGNSMVILQSPDKKTHFKAKGDRLTVGSSEVEIVEIAENQATLRRGEESIVLNVEATNGK